MLSRISADKIKTLCLNSLIALVLCLIVAVSQYSCGSRHEPEAAPPDMSWSQSYSRDGISLKVKTSKKEITVAEQLELELEATAPENLDVDFPAYSAALGDFTLEDTRVLPRKMTGSGDNARIVHQVVYLLKPYLSGIYTIPVMTVTFHERKQDKAAGEIATEKIEIPVKTLLQANTGQVEIKDIKPPLSLPPNRARQAIFAGIFILLAVTAISCFYFWNKRNVPAAAGIRPSPGDIARQELERLLAENLLANGQMKLFHLRISNILRRYIEDRFGVKAPERTTEEFLSALSRPDSPDRALLGSQKTLLADFLTQCDLVKFARHEPSIAESEKTVVICREFIAKTKEQDPRGQGVKGPREN